MRYWLIKSEPATFSIQDLAAAPNQTTTWEGVRNYQARNMMRDEMKVGDLVFFYHSNCDTPGITGIAKIIQAASPDLAAFDPNSDYYDPKSTPENPRWWMVTIQLQTKFKQIIPLYALRKLEELEDLALVQPGNRLSVMPVQPTEWEAILTLQKQRELSDLYLCAV